MAQEDQPGLGSLLIVVSAVAFSLAGFFTRLIPLDAWTLLFWRGLYGGLFIAGAIVWLHGRNTIAAVRAIGRAGLLVAACSTLGTICFINALQRTSVADVMVINATTPFFAAAIAWLWTRERESRVTLVCSAAAVFGVVLTFDGALPAGRLFGNLLALIMTILISLMMVIIRRHRDTPMLPAACLSALALPLLVAPAASPSAGFGSNFVYLVLFGAAQFGLGLLLLTLGTRLISATRSALIGSLETPLATLWVWFAFGEIPSLMTCVGGAVVMAVVIVDMLLARRNGGQCTRQARVISKARRAASPPHQFGQAGAH
jgi:drug/metabolite transporter (DMT)-like permease